MLQIATPVWNQIAPMAESLLWQRRMSMDYQGMTEEMESLGTKLRDEGAPAEVALAYQQVAPLLMERRAIQTFLRQNPRYREALPEILTVNEAILLMVREHNLTVSQTRILRKLLAATQPM